MLKEIARNLFYIAKAKGNGKKKWKVFVTLMKLSAKNKYSKKNQGKISSEFFGLRVTAFDYHTLHLLFKEVFCYDEYFFTASAKKPVIIDCGANIGMATLYLKKLFPDAEVHSFEANPFTYELLMKNINDNKIEGVTAHNAALYDEEKNLSFFISKNHGTLKGSVLEERGGEEEIFVKAKKLSGYIEKLDRIDLVKMDVEGAEWNIIKDLEMTGLLGKPDQYILEYHHNINKSNDSFAVFLKKFEDAGFGYSMKTSYENLKTFQDILIHFYKK